MRSFNKAVISLVLLLTLTILIFPLYSQTTYTWLGGVGAWNSPSNWQPNGIPGANDAVNIGVGVVLISNDISVTDMNLGGGDLYGGGKISVSGTLTWTAGNMTGDTTIAGVDTTEILAGGTLILGGTGSKDLENRVLINNGMAAWLDAGNIELKKDSKLVNTAGGIFDIRTDAMIDLKDSTPGSFENAGTITKSAGPGTATFDLPIYNSGPISVNSGALRFKKGGDFSGGTLGAASGKTINFLEGIYRFDGIVIDGDGMVRISGDSVAVLGGGLTINPAATLELAGGILAGANGVTTINGTFSWNKGLVNGPGALMVNGALDINGANSKTLNYSTLTNNNMVILSGSGDLRLKNGSQFNNLPGANFQIQSDAQVDYANPLGGNLINSGTITKSSGGSATIDVDFTNNAAVNVNSGTLLLNRGSNNSGTYSIASGATLQVGNLDHTFAASASVNGPGNLSFTGSGISAFSGAYNGSGTLGISNGQLNFSGAYNGTGAVQINGGIFNPNINATFTNLVLAGGFFSGSGDVNIANTFEWSGGTINKTGALVSNDTLLISGFVDKTLDGLVLTNTGVAIVSSSGNLDLVNNAQLENQPGAVIDFRSNLTVDYASPYGGVFNNAGTLIRSFSVGGLIIDVEFTNSGAINIESGSMKLSRGSSISSGSCALGSNTFLQFSLGFHALDNVDFTGDGTVELTSNNGILNITGGGVTFGPGVSLELNSGLLAGDAPLTVNGPFGWSKGTIGGSGAFTFNGPVNISGDTDKLIDGQVFNSSGPLTWTGSSDIRLKNGAVLDNKAGGVFDFQSEGQIKYNTPGGGTFINAGTLAKSNSLTTTAIEVDFTNSGTVSLTSGSLELRRNSELAGIFDLSPGCTLVLNGGSHNFSGVTLQGGGTTVLTSSAAMQVNTPGLTINSPGAFEMTNSTLNINAPVIMNGAFNWNSGDISGPASITLNDTMELLGGTAKTLDGITLVNNHVINLVGDGALKLLNNAHLNNQAGATFNIQNDLLIDYIFPGGGSFTNAGTVRKSGSGGNTVFNIDFQNAGLLDIHSGELTFNKSLTNEASSGIIQGKAILDINSANFFNNGVVRPGSSPGILTLLGDYPQSAAADLQVEIGGNTVGSQYDRLDVQGTAQLGGTLEVSLVNNFVPTVGDVFRVVAYTSQTGQFSTFISPTKDGQNIFDVSYQPDGVLLTTVVQMNRHPLAENDLVTTNEDTEVSFNALANDFDPDGDAMAIFNYTQAANGVVAQLNDSSFSYSPSENFFGADTFLYMVSDPENAIDTGLVAIQVQPVNDPPLLTNFPAELTFWEDDSLSLGLDTLVVDIDDPIQNLVWNMEFPGNPGIADSIQMVIDITSNLLIFIPRPNFNILNQQAVITVCDTSNACDQDTAILNILPVNDPPVISGLPASVSFNSGATTTLNTWQYVNDLETEDSLLTYSFTVSNDSLLHSYNAPTGDLTLSVIPGFSGTVLLGFEVQDPENASASDTFTVNVSPVVGIGNLTGDAIPHEFALQQNFPNPFNPNTAINFQLPAAERVKLTIYNILGQKVRTLVNERLKAGYYKVMWNGMNNRGRQMASGIYIYRIEAGNFVMVRKMTLIR